MLDRIVGSAAPPRMHGHIAVEAGLITDATSSRRHGRRHGRRADARNIRVSCARHHQPRLRAFSGAGMAIARSAMTRRSSGPRRARRRQVIVVGQQKGSSTEENIQRNSDADPEGYRKRCASTARAKIPRSARNSVDRPARIPAGGGGRASRGIASSIHLMTRLGSPCRRRARRGRVRGALALGVGDVVLGSRTRPTR